MEPIAPVCEPQRRGVWLFSSVRRVRQISLILALSCTILFLFLCYDSAWVHFLCTLAAVGVTVAYERIDRENYLLHTLHQVTTSFGSLETQVRLVAKKVHADMAFISISDSFDTPKIVTTKLVYLLQADGFVDNFSYVCSGTPCDYVVNQPAEKISDGVLIYPRDIQFYFPHDAQLQEFGAAAYAGVPLFLSTSGRKFGLFGLIFKNPLDTVQCALIRSVLMLTSHKIAFELEKMQLEQASQAKDGLIKKLGERIHQLHAEAWEVHQQMSKLSIPPP